MNKRSQSLAILATFVSVLAIAWALTKPAVSTLEPVVDSAALTPADLPSASSVPGARAPAPSNEPGAPPSARPSRIVIEGSSNGPVEEDAAARERAIVLERYARKRAAREAKNHGEPIEIYSDDPTNQKVLGPGRWMAQPPESVTRALDDTIDSSPAPAELDRQRRVNHAHQTARTVAADAASECVSLHAASLPMTTGRILLDLSVSSDRGQARVDHVAVTSIVDMEHPDLRTCLTSGLTGAAFPAQPLEQPLSVRVPLFFRDGRPAGR